MISTRRPCLRPRSLLAPLLVFALLPLHPAQAERPASTKLFPKETLAYLSIPSSQGLVTRFSETSLGLMAQDPQMKPLVEQLYTAILDAAKPLEETLGVSVPELLQVPNGELAIGLVAPENSRPALLALLDTGENVQAVQTLLERAERALSDAGAARQSEKVGDVEITVYTIEGRRQRQVVYLQRQGTLIIGTDLSVVRNLLKQWNEDSLPSLSENPQFAAVKRNVVGGSEEPQLVWFIDPINAVKEFGRGNSGATVAIALFPALGLDGLQGIGGSMAFAQGQFDGVSRIHVLLEAPRTGVVEMIALGTGEVTPESWVPAQAATYTTLHWDVMKTYKKLETLIDSFQGQGAFKRQVQQRVPRGIELDVEKELLAHLAGRITYITQIEEPITPRSQMQLLGVKLVDGKAAMNIFDRISNGFRDVVEQKNYLGKPYVQVKLGNAADAEAAQAQPSPCIGIVGDYLLLGRESLLQKAMLAMNDPSKSLGESLDFKLIASKAQRQSGGNRPSMFSFQRPEEGLRFLHGLANADSTRQGLARQGENNPFLKNVSSALEKNPLPPLSHLKKYVAPGGSVMISDDTGIRYTTFTLRRTDEN